MTDTVEAARSRLVDAEDEYTRACEDFDAPDYEVEELRIVYEDAEAEYWDTVDTVTEAAIAECEDLMEKGVKLW